MRKKREEEEQKKAISTNLGLKRSCFIMKQEQHALKKKKEGTSRERGREKGKSKIKAPIA